MAESAESKDAPLGQQERREQIRRGVLADGYVRIEELSEQHGVSAMTIHRDLDLLERQGWLRKVRGGATATPAALLESSVRARIADAADEKALIAEHACRLVTPGQVVAIDDSTSALAVAQRLPGLGPLTVVTNFLSVINLLSGEPGMHVISLGGDYYPSYDAFLGLHTADMAARTRSDVLFMSTTAIVDQHCLHRSQETVLVKRALMRTAAKRVLIADHTKFDRRAVHELAPLTEFELVIVDPATPQEVRDRLDEAEVTWEVARGTDPAQTHPRELSSRRKRS